MGKGNYEIKDVDAADIKFTVEDIKAYVNSSLLAIAAYGKFGSLSKVGDDTRNDCIEIAEHVIDEISERAETSVHIVTLLGEISLMLAGTMFEYTEQMSRDLGLESKLRKDE